AQWQIVNDLVTYNTFFVNQERTTEGYATFRFNIVGTADFVFNVSHQGVFNRTDATIVDRRVTPGVVRELRVDRHTDNFYIALLKLRVAVIKCQQFGRTYKGEVQRVKENYGFFAFDGRGQGIAVNNLTIAQNSGSCEIRCWFTY